MTNYDQFALWLSNRKLIDNLEAILNEHQDAIIEAFGGFKEMVKLCLSAPNNINLFQHQDLFQLFSDIAINDSVACPTNTPLLSMNDNSISSVFKFLPAIDHQHLQQTCRELAIIGRHKESYILDNGQNGQKYKYFGKHLTHVHRFSNFIQDILSNDVDKQAAALKQYPSHREPAAKLVASSGILR